MPTALFKFLPDLNSFLAPKVRQESYHLTFNTGQSVKHLIESAGVPHTEVGQIEADQQTVNFDYLVQDGDQVMVYPFAPGQGIPPDGTRFVLDNHLGRLAAYLRMLGFDSIYRNDLQDDELAQIASLDTRILLTRDRRLLMRRAVRFGYCLRSTNTLEQASEILRRYNLAGQISPFKRCLRCNARLKPVSKDAVLDRLEPLTKRYYEDFHQCPACGQIYWKGSHYEHMQSIVNRLQSDHPA